MLRRAGWQEKAVLRMLLRNVRPPQRADVRRPYRPATPEPGRDPTCSAEAPASFA